MSAGSTPRRKTVGVIGGMGPAATADFFRRLVEATHADRDQDHVHVLIESDPAIPDRTLALVGRGPSPLPKLVAIAHRLEELGADLLVMPCNTAHAYANDIAGAVAIPLVSWVGETAAYVAGLDPRPSRVGVLATTGTVTSGVYQTAIAAAGIDTLLPSASDQADVMEAVYGLKAGILEQPRVHEVLAELVARGADAVVLGCTELPSLDLRDPGVPLVDPAMVVAARVVALAGGTLRPAASAA